MEMVNVFIFVVSTLILPPDQVASQSGVSKCLQIPPDPNVFKTSEYDKWCYFVMRGSMTDANEKVQGGWRFNISKAREICQAVNATLPILRNREEDNHISENYLPWPRDLINIGETVALGLKQSHNGFVYVYEWDDNSTLTYKADQWVTQDKKALYTIMVGKDPHGTIWENVQTLDEYEFLVGVVCQQPLHPTTSPPTTSTTPTTTTSTTPTTSTSTSTTSASSTPASNNTNTSPPPIETPSTMAAPTGILCYLGNSTDTTYFEIRGIFEDGKTKACYFTVNGSDAMANKKDTNTGLYRFNITAAREICAQYNATLPSIHSFAEQVFLQTKGLKSPFRNYSLGLQQVPLGEGYEYKWDDGSKFDYQAPWTTKYNPSNYTISIHKDYDRPRDWINVGDQEVFEKPVAVICKQLHPFEPKPTTAKNISSCGQQHRQNYALAAVFGQSCYFVVKGATDLANKLSLDQNLTVRYGIFKPWVAREICQNESATLPTITDEDEHNFIMATFKPEMFAVEPAETIMLDLMQVKGVNDYHWADDTPFSFYPPNWNKAEYAYHTAMNLQKSEWVNRNSTIVTTGLIGVLCKKPHFEDPIEPSTAEPSTVEPVTSPSPFTTVCDNKSASVELVRMFEDRKTKACYFIVKKSADNANQEEHGVFLFNITIAREICAQYNATLPSIHSIAEDNFLYFPSSKSGDMKAMNFSLGLQQLPVDDEAYKYAWDDGSNFDYEAFWTTKYNPASYTVSVLNEYGRTRSWINVDNKATSKHPTVVLCKQLYPTKSEPTPTKMISNCNIGQKHKYTKTAVFEGIWCYFVVKGSTNLANSIHMVDENNTKNVSFQFYPSIAREICQDEAATLPVINSENEQIFIKTKFKPDDFKMDNPTRAKTIMLDLKQGKNVSDYIWGDGTQVTYQPSGRDDWLHKTNYSYFTVMSFENRHWRNKDKELHSNPIGVLCKQRYFRETDVLTPTVCDQVDNKNTSLFPFVGMFTEGNPLACYFTVNGSIEETNKEQNGSYIFDITQAYEICRRHKANLPSIHSIAEERFLKDHTFALGLHQDVTDGLYTYKWNDGSKFDYQPEWPTKYQTAQYTISGLLGVEELRKWHNAIEQDLFNHPIAVLCKQSYPTTPTPSPTPPDEKYVTVCHPSRQKNYAKTFSHGDRRSRHVCYFVVHGSTKMANKIVMDQNGSFSYFIFNPLLAREICQNESASLASIETENEHTEVLKNLKSLDEFKLETAPSQTISADGVLLDLKQGASISDYQWSDGTRLSYNLQDWKSKEEYAFFTTLSISDEKLQWENKNSAAGLLAPIGVLCQQQIYMVPPPKTTIPPPPPPPPPQTKEPETEAPTQQPPDQPPSTPSSSLQKANKCKLPENERNEHYVKVVQSGDHFCYFVVKGLIEHSNLRTGDRRFKFHVDEAVTVCKEHGGQLPILWDKEHKFILDNFQAKDMDPTGKLGEFSGVALGLKGESDEKGMKVKWSDGTEEASFSKDHWIMESGNFDYAVMYRTEDGGIEWLPGDPSNKPQSKPVGVVCQQIVTTTSSGNRLVKPTLIISVVAIVLMK